MQSISNVKIPGFSEQTTSLTKRAGDPLTLITSASTNFLGAIAIGAFVFLAVICMIALVQYVRVKISQVMMYGTTLGGAYGPAVYGPSAYDPYYPAYPYGMY
jgi:hypothetical protein